LQYHFHRAQLASIVLNSYLVISKWMCPRLTDNVNESIRLSAVKTSKVRKVDVVSTSLSQSSCDKHEKEKMASLSCVLDAEVIRQPFPIQFILKWRSWNANLHWP